MPLFCFVASLLEANHFLLADITSIMADLNGGIEFPVYYNNPVFAYITMGDAATGTQQGATWWDGDEYIYKQGVSTLNICHIND